jgi:Domain of unknown function (DUF4157)
MDYFQPGRRDASASISTPIQAKEKAGKGAGLAEAPGREAHEGEHEEGGEAGGGAGGRGGSWRADAGLMSAMGLPELGEAAEGEEGGEAGGAPKDKANATSATAEEARENATDQAKQKAHQRKKKRGAPKGESKVPGGQGGGEAGSAGGGAVQRKGLGEVGDLLGGRGAATQDAALGAIPTSGGAPVDRGIASGVERATGQSVGDVQVHTGDSSAAAANSISARAFTSGNNIHMGANESPSDAKLMSHELAHTIQQTQGAKVQDGVSSPGDSLEVEADRIADAALSGGSAPVTVAAGGSTLMRDAVSDVESLLSYGAFDWAITDDEATQALAILAAMPQAQLGPALGRLGQQYKTRLLENLPEAAKRTSGFTKVLVALGPDAVMPYVQGLLSYGVFDWAVTDAEAAEVFQILKAMPAVQGTLATKLGASFRSRLASNLQRVSAIGPEEYALLRVLFNNTPDAEVMTLCRWTALRFNVKVESSTDKDGAAWDKRGLTRVWDVLQVLPPEHVESNGDLKSLTRYRTGGGISGWASTTGEAAIGYGDSTDLPNAQNNSQAGDPLNGVNRFDKVMRHEIGHRVDDRVGGPAYTATDAGGGWEKFGKGVVAERMVNASAGKISTWANADQKKAIIDCLQTIVNDRKPDQIDARLGRLSFVASHATDAAQAALLADIKGDAAVTQLSVCFEDQSPWYSLATGGTPLGGKIFQESYTNDWVSYKAEARTRKVSQYQFRAPGEWFAEAYAAYYEPPGAKGAVLAGRDAASKTWFDSNVDPQNGAGGTTPPAAPAPAGPAAGP